MRKKETLSSAGTNPMKMYDRISFRLTLHRTTRRTELQPRTPSPMPPTTRPSVPRALGTDSGQE